MEYYHLTKKGILNNAESPSIMKRLSKIILHIGAEKTGTTTIQKFMASNRDAFEENGILYPITPGIANHTRVAIYAANLNKKLGRFKNIHDEYGLSEFRIKFEQDLTREIQASDADVLVLSAEWLHPRISENNEFDRLSRLLYRFADDVIVLFYIRRQDEMLVSLYSTSLRAGNTKEFFFPRVFANALPYYLDYSAIAHKWSTAFGANSFKLRIFAKQNLFNGDLIQDFMYATEIPWRHEYVAPNKHSNQAINLVGQELIRLFNIIAANNGFPPHVVRKVINRLESEYVGRGIPVARDEAVLFYSNFLASNEVLRARYFPDSSELFHNDFSAYPTRPPIIDKKNIESILSDLLVHMGI